MQITFECASDNDVPALVQVQNQSFYADYIQYGFSPGYHASETLLRRNIKNHFVYKIICEGKIIGVIIVRKNGNGRYFLSCLCLLPAFQNKGIGSQAFYFLDALLPMATHWALETPSANQQNLRFYQKHGFAVTKERVVRGVRTSFLEKTCLP